MTELTDAHFEADGDSAVRTAMGRIARRLRALQTRACFTHLPQAGIMPGRFQGGGSLFA